MKESNKSFENLEKALKYEFKDKNLLKLALTHSSYANEQRKKTEDNERLEFLGDAVLGLVIADYLHDYFLNSKEGQLTKLRATIVSEEPLAEIARGIELGQYLYLGKGENNTGGRDRVSILADGMEALIGALYIEGGIELAKRVILNLFMPVMQKSFKGQGFKDYKTSLQEILQQNSLGNILYEVVSERGPDHDKEFFVNVYHENKKIGFGKGKSKKEAEQDAARMALKNNNE